jgi:hypothetical protein
MRMPSREQMGAERSGGAHAPWQMPRRARQPEGIDAPVWFLRITTANRIRNSEYRQSGPVPYECDLAFQSAYGGTPDLHL